MPSTVRAGAAEIGDDRPVFVIAEAGVNHNGDAALALELVRQAHACGADCVKFQTFGAARLVTPDAPKAAYQLEQTNPRESQLDMLRKLELPESAYADLIKLCTDLGIAFLSTPYSFEDVDFLCELGVDALKLASIHCAEPMFVEYAARTGKAILLSTGMATLAEVAAAVDATRGAGNERLILLQCTTNYPSRCADANLRVIPALRQAFDAPVGYSDHTQSSAACIAAVALGACAIEKHFTLDRRLPGPDQSSSADPAELAALVRSIREAQSALGSATKQPTAAERANLRGMRRSLAARRALRAGQRIDAADLALMRPATGIAPACAPLVLGASARRDIPCGSLLRWEDLELAPPR